MPTALQIRGGLGAQHAHFRWQEYIFQMCAYFYDLSLSYTKGVSVRRRGSGLPDRCEFFS